MAMALPTSGSSPSSTPTIQPSSSPASSASSSSSSIKSAQPVDIRTHNPIPLTASQEGQIRDLYYKRVRDKCADEIREFAHCATGRTFTIPIVCRKQRLAMNSCMIAHATRKEEDRAREEWFQKVPVRQAEKEEWQRYKEIENKKHREWWGLDEHGRRIIQQPSKPGGTSTTS